MLLNNDDYENARLSRDARFDGRFFIGVITTGIYCRPVCPVRVPKKENVQLYKSAAAAAAAGFRPCLRCRPESSPGTPAWSGSSWKVSRALQLIDQGFLDDDSVDALAAQIDVGPRQLSRLFQNHLGASPIEVAQTRRLHFAKKLLDETKMSFVDICYASGFGSVRRFNAVFTATYGRSPKQLRAKARSQSLPSVPGITLRLSYRPPFDWRALLAFLAYRAIPGAEAVTETSYSRTIRLGDKVGDFAVNFQEGSNVLEATINFSDSRHLYHIIDRIRSLFDLRADSAQIDQFLARDKFLRPIIKKFPGQRVPGCWDGFEVAVRAILGQQVTVKAASTLVARLTARYGERYTCANPALTHVFPDTATMAAAEMDNMGIVGQRIAAIRAVAAAIETEELHIHCMADTADFVRRICAIKGIGEWTAHYIAMRALNDPNAFPHSDLILLRAAAEPGATLTPKQLLARAEPWQPWRAYTVILLWRHYVSIQKQASKKQSTKKQVIKKQSIKKQSNRDSRS